MAKITVFTIVSWLVLAGAAFAQARESARAPIGTVLDLWVTKIEKTIIPAADALPASSYGFAPTAGAFGGVRTFAEQITHLAAANYQLAALVLREEPPAGTQNETAPASIRTKADVMTYLKNSFASLHRAAARINVQNVEDPIVVGNETQNGVGLVVDALAHAMDHYGQIVEYLRMNDVVPPSSRKGS